MPGGRVASFFKVRCMRSWGCQFLARSARTYRRPCLPKGGGEATLCFNHIAPYAAHPQSITEAIQVLASGSDQTRYGIQPLSRSARATSAGCAVADAEKPADNVPRYDVSIRTGYSLAFEVREALGFAVRRCILQWRQTTAGSIIDPAPAGGRMTSMD
jgi:hypothetical protein